MSHETLSILVMLNNYFHDMSVGLLFANVMLTIFLVRLLGEHGAGDEKLLARFVSLSSRITWAALGFIIVGGAIRTAAYRDFEWSEAAGRGQIAALVLKHIILVGCTVAGIAFQIRMSRRYRGAAANEEEQGA